MADWAIKFSCFCFLWALFTIGSGVHAARPLAPSRLQAACEKALIASGLWNPPAYAAVTEFPTDAVAWSKESLAYDPSSYDSSTLKSLRYYPAQFLSQGYLQGKNVLDLNCGNGDFVEELRRRGIDAVGLGIKLTGYQLSKPYFVLASATRTGLPDESADLIVSTLGVPSLFYAADPDLVLEILREALRILRKGGTLLISPIHIPVPRWFTFDDDVSHQNLLKDTVFMRLPHGLRIKSAPDLDWLSTPRDPELNNGRPPRANYWLELERTD